MHCSINHKNGFLWKVGSLWLYSLEKLFPTTLPKSQNQSSSSKCSLVLTSLSGRSFYVHISNNHASLNFLDADHIQKMVWSLPLRQYTIGLLILLNQYYILQQNGCKYSSGTGNIFTYKYIKELQLISLVIVEDSSKKQEFYLQTVKNNYWILSENQKNEHQFDNISESLEEIYLRTFFLGNKQIKQKQANKTYPIFLGFFTQK